MSSTPSQTPAANSKRSAKMPAQQVTNLNHLLNFSLPPRQTRPLSSLPRRSRKVGNVQGVWNKERFVNAQYRFVMNPSGDYTVHFADPDIFFQWNDILQVIIPRSSALASAAANNELTAQGEGYTTCPICLSPPTAPRMTKCGHVFCFPCILHYLSTSDNKWARCPICFDSVHERQLKSVKWYDGPTHTAEDRDSVPNEASSSSSTLDNTPLETTPTTGSNLRMRLVQRPQITTLALPRSSTWPSDLIPPHQAPFYFLPDVYDFAKFMLATPAYLISNLTRDLDELATERRMLAAMDDSLGLIFVDGADCKVREQIAKATALETPVLRDQIQKAERDQREIETRVAAQEQRKKAEEDVKEHPPIADVPHEFLSSRSGGLVNSSAPPTPAAPTPAPAPVDNSSNRNQQNRSHPRQRKNVNPPPPSTSTYYYYQAASGLPLFLHPLDIRILLSHFHSYASFPNEITVRVESVAEGTVDDDLRKRCKYLGHMPEGADVVFVEADLEGVVGAEALKSFEGALKMRTTRRKEKGRKEDRARLRAEEKEREKIHLPFAGLGGSMPSAAPAAPVYYSDVHAADEFSTLGASDADDSHSHSPPAQAAAAPISGAWGARSFASALHSNAAAPRRPNPNSSYSQRAMHPEDEWELDVAWHELEARSAAGGGGGGGGRKKRANKMVVLGGGGAGARRR